jgi:threonyl-tRNA synthetase
MRIRGFVQDDAHIFCTEEQISGEVGKFCRLMYGMYEDFGFDKEKVLVKLSTRPVLRVGDDATWDRAEAALADACKAENIAYTVSPGEGAFYGPKLEFTLIDALSREWQCGTIQLDYQMPSKERLDAEYVGEDNQRHTPVMLHRAALGSMERFLGILIEHYAGAFPAWLHYQPAVVIPVSPVFNEYAQKVAAALEERGIRVTADVSTDRMNAKIRFAQTQKIPSMLVVGEKEAADGTVTVRYRDARGQDLRTVADFAAYVAEKVAARYTGI